MTPTSCWEPSDQTAGDNEATALRAHVANETESSTRGRKLHAMATKDNEFSILNPTLAFIANPEPAISEMASHAVQISRIRRQNTSAEVDVDSFAEELERVSISAVQTKGKEADS